jgi:hypothetical protein
MTFWCFRLRQLFVFKSGSMAELANGSVVRPRDPGPNLGIETKFSYSVIIEIKFRSVGQ